MVEQQIPDHIELYKKGSLPRGKKLEETFNRLTRDQS